MDTYANNALIRLAAHARENKQSGPNYAGEVTPQEVHAFLNEHDGMLVDVRTDAEWSQVGVPDLDSSRGNTLFLSWKISPSYALNPLFIEALTQQAGITKDTPMFFMCRSGGRSLDAASAMTEAGYHYCYNVSGGFEGKLGEGRGIPGWKSLQLPWRQK